MVHITNEIMPIWILINKRSPIDIELEHSLEPAVDIFEKSCVTFYSHDVKLLHVCGLRFVISVKLRLCQNG